MSRFFRRLALIVAVTAIPAPLLAAERLCDPAHEDCRAILINLIRAEQTGIDAAFWFMEDARYSSELIKKAREGVAVRVLVDPRANVNTPLNGQILAELAAAGIPMRQRVSSGILHWKMMLFAGQRTVEFSGANFSPDALVFTEPYRNYVDEAIFFSDDLAIVQSFMRRFDDRWTDTVDYADYANVAAPSRHYPLYPIDPALNFPPLQDYRSRATARYNAEQSAIDVIMFRLTDRAHSDAIINAVNRGVPVRLITEQEQYRDPTRLWDSWNVDRLYMAGVQVRLRGHLGLNHQKSVILRGQGLVIFGSSNWTSPSTERQDEHNYFATKPWISAWFEDQFERKWNNLGTSAETEPFRPLPPGPVGNVGPANGAPGQPQSTALRFDAGPYAHLYDIYLGTTPEPPLIAATVELGPTETSTAPRQYLVTPLAPSTTYYWRVVAKTMAYQTKAGPVWSFTTGAFPASPQPAPQPSRPSARSTDLDGDRRGDLTVWRRSTGTWFSLTSTSGYAYGSSTVRQWGNQDQGDVPLMGDMDGDGKSDLVVWRASSGTWFWLLSSSRFSPAAAGVKQWGNRSLGDIPFLAEMDGDGKMDLVVWRASTGTWYWLTSASGYNYNASGSRTFGDQSAGDIPKLGDLDGDGIAELIVWRAVNGTWMWLASRSGYNSPPQQKQWGNNALGDRPFLGDLDGDGKMDLVIWRSSSGTWFWLTSSTSYDYARSGQRQWGNHAAGDVPLAPTDLDGDNTADLVVWRASSGTWFWLTSSSHYNPAFPGVKQWGAEGQGDRPMVN